MIFGVGHPVALHFSLAGSSSLAEIGLESPNARAFGFSVSKTRKKDDFFYIIININLCYNTVKLL